MLSPFTKKTALRFCEQEATGSLSTSDFCQTTENRYLSQKAGYLMNWVKPKSITLLQYHCNIRAEFACWSNSATFLSTRKKINSIPGEIRTTSVYILILDSTLSHKMSKDGSWGSLVFFNTGITNNESSLSVHTRAFSKLYCKTWLICEIPLLIRTQNCS